MGAFAPIHDYVESLVHPSAQQDALTAARHHAFIAPRLSVGVVALGSFPFYLIVRGTPSAAELIVFGWPAVPILAACFLSRTGHYEGAHVLSAVALIGFAVVVAVFTGGIGSFAAVWFVVAPLEAALSASRRVVATASAVALGAAATLALFAPAHGLPTNAGQGWTTLAALGTAFAVFYAAALALAAADLARAGLSLLQAEGDHYRFLAHVTTDVITRHALDGDVLFASPAAESLFAAPVAALHGRGLLQRVHVADRPAYLMALGDAAALAKNRSAEFRVRRDEGPGAASFVWIEMQCRPLQHATGASATNGREVVALLRAVTERKQGERSLEHMRAERDHAAMPVRKIA